MTFSRAAHIIQISVVWPSILTEIKDGHPYEKSERLLAAVRGGEIIALVELPIAGLMSDKPIDEMVEKISALKQAWMDMGCTIPSPFMTMGLIALACIPELRLTNRGLVDCTTFSFSDLKVK